MSDITLPFRVTKVAKDITQSLIDGNKITVVYGGIRAGKTYAIPISIAAIGLTRQGIDLSTGQTSPLKILVTRRTMGEIKQSMAEPFRRVLGSIQGTRFIDAGEHKRWVLPNGTEITWRQYSLPSTKGDAESTIEGLGFHLLYGDEASQYPSSFYTHSIERASQPSIDINGRVYPGQVVWLSRPAHDIRFLTEGKRLIKEGMKGRIIYARTRDMLDILGHDYLDAVKASRSLQEYNAITQEVVGATYPAKGAIYDNFSWDPFPKGNVIDIPLDKTHPTTLAIDPGVAGHTSCLWIQKHAINGIMRHVVVDEYHPDGTCRAPDVVQEAHKRGWNITEAVIDPASEARNAVSPSTYVAVLRRSATDRGSEGPGLGCPVKSVIPSPKRGIKDGVYKLQAAIENAKGERIFLVHKSLIETPKYDRGISHSLMNYTWDLRTGMPTKGDAAKQADHCMDAARYYTVHNLWSNPSEPVADWRNA